MALTPEQRLSLELARAIIAARGQAGPANPADPTTGGGYSPFVNEAALFAPTLTAPVYQGVPDNGMANDPSSSLSRMTPDDVAARQRSVELGDTRSSLQRLREWLDGTADTSAHGFLLGGDDELTRLIGPDDEAAALEARTDQFRQDNPTIAAASEIAGGMGIGAGANRAGTTLLRTRTPSPLNMAVRGTAEGAAYGGIYGGLDAEGGLRERIRAAGYGALGGAAFGAGLGTLVGAAARRSARNQTPTPAELADRKTQAYRASDQAGGVVSPSATYDLALAVRNRLAQAQIPLNLQPKAVKRAIRMLDEASLDDLKLGGLAWIRAQIRDSGKNPATTRTLRIIADEIQDFADNLTPAQLSHGTAAAVPLRRAADRANVLNEKSKVIESAFFRASTAGVRVDPGDAIAAEFRRISRKPKLFNQFNEAEQASILRVARGEGADTILAAYGQVRADGVVNLLRSGLGIGSVLARRTLAGRTRARAEVAGQTVRGGGKPPVNSTNPLLGALMAGGAISMNQPPPWANLGLGPLLPPREQTSVYGSP